MVGNCDPTLWAMSSGVALLPDTWTVSERCKSPTLSPPRGRVTEVASGETLFIPCGAVHGFNNLKPSNAKALAVVTPALIGPEFFREMAAIINVGGPPDMERIKAVMNRHGLVPAPPQK